MDAEVVQMSQFIPAVLPSDIPSATSLLSFRKNLKTYSLHKSVPTLDLLYCSDCLYSMDSPFMSLDLEIFGHFYFLFVVP